MKSIRKMAVLSLCVLMLAGCGSKIPTLSNGEEVVVSLKDDANISADTLYKELKNSFGLQALINMIDKQILEKEYEDLKDDAKDYAESQIESLKQTYGDDALAAIQYYTNYSTMEAYQESLYISYLQNEAIEDYGKSLVTDKEIEKYYKDDVVGDIKVSHILITADVEDGMSDDDKKKAEDAAKETAKKVIKELQGAKKEDVAKKFEELAKEYSKDKGTSSNGGNLGFINKGTLDSAYDELVDAAYKLKDGEYSTNYVTTELGYHIILRTESKDKASLEDIKDSIIETLGREKLQKDQTLTITALQELRKKYNMEFTDTELQKQYANYIQSAKAQIKNQQNSSTK